MRAHVSKIFWWLVFWSVLQMAVPVLSPMFLRGSFDQEFYVRMTYVISWMPRTAFGVLVWFELQSLGRVAHAVALVSAFNPIVGALFYLLTQSVIHDERQARNH